MSIFNDDRRYSDDPEEYLEWKHEVEQECRRNNQDPWDAYEESEDEDDDTE